MITHIAMITMNISALPRRDFANFIAGLKTPKSSSREEEFLRK
jgi:hypothetical protein